MNADLVSTLLDPSKLVSMINDRAALERRLTELAAEVDRVKSDIASINSELSRMLSLGGDTKQHKAQTTVDYVVGMVKANPGTYSDLYDRFRLAIEAGETVTKAKDTRAILSQALRILVKRGAIKQDNTLYQYAS